MRDTNRFDTDWTQSRIEWNIPGILRSVASGQA